MPFRWLFIYCISFQRFPYFRVSTSIYFLFTNRFIVILDIFLGISKTPVEKRIEQLSFFSLSLKFCLFSLRIQRDRSSKIKKEI